MIVKEDLDRIQLHLLPFPCHIFRNYCREQVILLFLYGSFLSSHDDVIFQTFFLQLQKLAKERTLRSAALVSTKIKAHLRPPDLSSPCQSHCHCQANNAVPNYFFQSTISSTLFIEIYSMQITHIAILFVLFKSYILHC